MRIVDPTEKQERRFSICINGDQPSVSFTSDGGVVFHEGYPVSEVAKVFWAAMAHANPLAGEVERLRRELEELRARAVK